MKQFKDFRTIGFYKLDNRFGIEKEYYYYTYANNCEKEFAFNVGDNYVIQHDWADKWKDVEITEEAKQKIIACREEFKKMLKSILKKDSTFNIAQGEHYMIAYRREHYKKCRFERCFYGCTERGDLFRFIIFFGGGRVTQLICTVEGLIERFDFDTLTDSVGYSKGIAKNLEMLKEGKFPLLKSAEKHDRHLYLTMKYMAGIATQEEADEATAIDKQVRFVPEDKVYGEEVTVRSIEQFHLSFFNRSERYHCKITIDSREWDATWYPNTNKLYIWQYLSHGLGNDYIEITDDLKGSIAKRAVKKYISLWGQK